MSTIFQAECNEFLVTSVVKIISPTVFPDGSRARVTHMRVFVLIIDVSKMRCLFPKFQGCVFFRAAGAEKDESAEKSRRFILCGCLRCFDLVPII